MIQLIQSKSKKIHIIPYDSISTGAVLFKATSGAILLSFDSGYPVKLAISGVKLGEEKEKPNVIIDDFYNTDLSDQVKELIIYNVTKMRDLI